ncbi:unnamed protein product [Camellia sinensis]
MDNANEPESSSTEARMERMERMIELITARLEQQQNQQPPPPPPPPVQPEPNANADDGDIIALTHKFSKMKPPSFQGGLEPLKAEAWVLETEKLFEVFPCSEANKVLLATFTLQEEARRWWMLIRETNTVMTWAQFKESFFEKYFPQCVRDRKVTEFEQLKQGTMSVAEYETKFTELARYAPHMVDTEYKKARKFEGGLNVAILDRINVLKLPTFVGVLDRALMAESNIAAVKQSETPTTEWHGKRQGFKFKKGKHNPANKKQNTGLTTSPSQGSGFIPPCSECGKKHKGVCYRISGACYRCGKVGHMVKDCPSAPQASGKAAPSVPSAQAELMLRNACLLFEHCIGQCLSACGGHHSVVLIITVPVSTFMIVALGFYFYRLFGRRSKAREVLQGMSQEILLNNLESQTRKRFMVKGLEVQDEDDNREMHYFDLTTLQIATNNFSDANKLGEGGFGPVYKGKLHDGKEIAVKRLSSNSGQGLEEFRTEVKLIVKLQHRNLVRLLGCCIKKDEKLLVYEYMANTSLDAFLFDSTKCKELDWAKRENIVTGIAKGLLYLHEDSRLKIIHRDMKASNVLLDNEMNPKISDFGTARISYGNQIEASTNRIVGTYGYMAPEYAMEGIFSVKSDIYSFGVLMLEIISGRKNSAGFNLPAHAQGFLQNAWRLWNDGKAQELIDRNLIDRNLISSCPVRKVAIWINIALLCVQENPDDRPSMSKVAFMLGGQSTEIAKPSEPPFSVGRYPKSGQQSSTGEGTEPASASLTLLRD